MPAGWVAAGAAAVGAYENIQGNNAAQSTAGLNNASIAQTQTAQGDAFGDAIGIAQQKFQPYTAPLTAPMTGNQKQAYGLASTSAGTGASDVAKGTAQIDSAAGSTWNPTTQAEFMNPYENAVNTSAIANLNEQYGAQKAGFTENEAGSDAFGGGRAAISESNLDVQHDLAVGSLTATNNAKAYDTAFQNWQSDQGMKLNIAKAYDTAGQDVTQMNSSDIADLLKTGGVAQVINQTNLTNEYGQFLRKQGWSAQQLAPLISALSAAKGGNSQGVPPASNVANQLLGLGSTLGALSFGGGTSSGSAGTNINYNPTLSDTSGSVSNANSYLSGIQMPVANTGGYGLGGATSGVNALDGG